MTRRCTLIIFERLQHNGYNTILCKLLSGHDANKRKLKKIDIFTNKMAVQSCRHSFINKKESLKKK